MGSCISAGVRASDGAFMKLALQCLTTSTFLVCVSSSDYFPLVFVGIIIIVGKKVNAY